MTAREMLPVEQVDRDFRSLLLKYIIETLDRPCSDGDMIDDRQDALDQIIARHRMSSTPAQPAPVESDAGRGEVREVVARIIDPELFDPDPHVRHMAASPSRVDAAQAPVLIKADAILAALPAQPAVSDGWEAAIEAAAKRAKAWGDNLRPDRRTDPNPRIEGEIYAADAIAALIRNLTPPARSNSDGGEG